MKYVGTGHADIAKWFYLFKKIKIFFKGNGELICKEIV